MDYLTAKGVREMWEITRRMGSVYSKERIPSAVKKGNQWLIPQDTEKPVNLRKK